VDNPLREGPLMPARVINLTVHGIGEPPRELDPGEDQTWVTVEQFEQVMDAAVGRDDVRITFDDGNSSDVEIALPRLVSRGLRAEFFVLAGLLGTPGRLTEADVRKLQMVASGLAADRPGAGGRGNGRSATDACFGHRNTDLPCRRAVRVL
jgi:peptidoglycan/xylan/chitin deacetylase (PgdA/CDA1 family)